MQIKKLKNIKSYSNFISESNEAKEKTQTYKDNWYLSESDIKILFDDLLAEGWNIDINYIFKSEEFDKINDYSYDWIENKILLYEDVIPAYYLTIIPKYKSAEIDEDIIDSLKNSIRALLYEVGSDEKKDLGFVVKDYYYSNYLDAIDSLIITKKTVDIFIAQDNYINVDEQVFKEHYELEVNSIFEDENTDNELIVYKEYDYIVRRCVKNSTYEEALIDGFDSISPHYSIDNYAPQNTIDLMYNLSKENEELLIKTIIKSLGGHKEVNKILKTNFESDEKAKEAILNERFHEMLNKLIDDIDEIINEVKNIIGDAFLFAHIEKNYREIEDEFLEKFSEILEFEIVEKNDKKYFKIFFDNIWVDNMDYEDIRYFKTLDDLFYDYESSLDMLELNPNLSDYASPKVDYNIQITEYLKSLRS